MNRARLNTTAPFGRLRYCLLVCMLLLARPALSATDNGCTPIPDLPDLVLKKQLVVLGEVHGTVEMPALAGDIVCNLLRLGRTVVLAIEVPSTEQQRITNYLDSDGSDAAQSDLVAGPHWQRKVQDGRSSEAMFTLIDQIRRMKREQARVSVKAIDGLTPGGTRDKTMAENIRSIFAEIPNATVVSLVGNVHASKRVGLGSDDHYQPLTYLLRDLDVASFVLSDSGGTAWVCSTVRPPTVTCGDSVRRSSSNTAEGEELLTRYDDKIEVGAIKASPPKVRVSK